MADLWQRTDRALLPAGTGDVTMKIKCRMLSPDDFQRYEAERLALAKRRGDDPDWLKAHNSTYGYASLYEVAGHCVMWSMPWYFDPDNPKHKSRRDTALELIAAGKHGRGELFLSIHYWQDWSDKRPPLCVITPSNVSWVVDDKSSNGDGWRVTGAAPLITCMPSISVPGYHGWLKDGEFSEPIP